MFKKQIKVKTKPATRHQVGQYPVVVREAEEGGYWVSCPVLEGCYSQGETIDEALTNIREAIALCLEESPARERQRAPSDVSLHFVRI